MSDCVDVEDFYFYTLRKCRIFQPSQFLEGKNKLATSSKFGVTIASCKNELRIVTLASLLSFKLTKENINVEVDNLPVKTVVLPTVEKIEQIGVNSDGSLLGILHSTKGNAIVDIYDLRTLITSKTLPGSLVQTRVGTDANVTGIAFEWNPAIPEMFACSSSDNALLCAKVDIANVKLSIVGSKKFGANATAISWSPKGKQLVIGDSVGKLVQLKPELDVVRTTMPLSNSAITGLCWLSTTEWLISYTSENPEDLTTNILVLKKDKPAEWTQLFDLSFIDRSSKNGAALMNASNLLVDWNVSLIANTKYGEVLPVGKATDMWQVWKVDDGKGINLPLNSARCPTFPIGISVDLTAQETVKAIFDETVTHPAAPVVLCLTTDGLLMSYHVISTNPNRKSVQRTAEPIQLAGALPFKSINGAAVQTPSPPVATSISTPTKPNFSFTGMSTPKPTSNTPVPVKAPAAEFGQPPSLMAVPKVDAVPDLVDNRKEEERLAQEKKEEERLAREKKEKEEKEAKEQKEKEAAERSKILAEKKTKLTELVDKVKTSLKNTEGMIGALSVGQQTMGPVVSDAISEVLSLEADAEEVLAEIRLLSASIAQEVEGVKKSIKEMDLEVQEKVGLVNEMQDPELIQKRLKEYNDVDKQIRFLKLEEAVDGMNRRYVEVVQRLEKVQKAQKDFIIETRVIAASGRRLSQEDNITNILKKRLAKCVLDVRDTTRRNERDLALLLKEKKSFVKATETLPSEGVLSQKITLPPIFVGILDMNESKKAAIQGNIKKNFEKKKPIVIKPVAIKAPEPFLESSMIEESSILNTTDLSNAIMKLSTTPRRAAAPKIVSKGRTVAIQVNEEVEKVIVTVEAPANTVSTPVTVNAGSAKTSTTSLFSQTRAEPSLSAVSQGTSPLQPASVKENAPQAARTIFGNNTNIIGKENVSKPPGNSLFGSGTLPIMVKKAQPMVENKQVPLDPAPMAKPQAAEPVKAPESAVRTPEHVVKQPEPAVTALEPVVKTPEPTMKSPEPIFKTPEPTVKSPEPIFKTPEPTVKSPEPIFKTPEPTVKSPEPIFKTEEPKVVTPEPTKPVENEEVKTTPPATPKVEVPPAQPKSLFGGTPTTTTANNTSSIFGGSSAPAATNNVSWNFNSMANSPTPATTTNTFGNFGQKEQKPAAAPSPAFGSFSQAASSAAQNTSPVSFSFNKSQPSQQPQQQQQTSSIFGGGTSTFGGQAKASGFGAAAAVAAQQQAVDDGMEDDIGGGNKGGSVFGGGFMSGLGSKPTVSTSSNIFAAKPTSTAPSTNSWLSGGATSKPPAAGSFGAMASSAAQQAQQGPVFGGGPKFGSGPTFGSAAQPKSSIFGGGASGNTAGGFAQFANKGSSLFGGGAQAQPQQTSSIFGGGAQTKPATSSIFGGGNTQQKPATSSIFGGGNTQQNNFNSWR